MLNPGTPDARRSSTVLDLVDLVLVMTVNPGLRRPGLHPAVSTRSRRISAMIGGRGRSTSRSTAASRADNARQVVAAGANVLVAGSAVFKRRHTAYKANIAAIRNARAAQARGECGLRRR